MTKGADDSVRSWRRAVKRSSTWGRIAARWSGAVLRMALGLTPQHIAETVIAVCKPWGLGVERMLGARVECRLQRSVRRIFPAGSRGAARRAKRAQGRSTQQLFPDKEGRRAGIKRVRSSDACTNNTCVTSSAKPQGLASIRRKASWAGCMAALNKPLCCVPWRGGGPWGSHRKVRRAGIGEGGRNGAPAQAPSCDRGRQRSRRHG